MSIEAQPFYFSSGSGELFAWLHPAPAGSASNLGLVLCKPFGYEAMCAHQSLRAWAQAAAAAGVPALRFDYAGTGDSSEADGEADQISVWSRGITDAAEILRQRCGVERVCLLGVRLGALAASIAAAQSRALDGLIAIMPVTHGRRYVRELRTFQGCAGEREAGLEVMGFRLSAATVARLRSIELAALAVPPAPDVLIVDRDDLPEASRWAQALARLGVNVRYQALPGYVEMMSTPHTSRVPQRMLEAATEWLASLKGHGPRRRRPAPSVPAESIRLRVDGGAVIERAMFIDTDRTLFAVVSEPDGAGRPAGAERPPGRPGVIWLNGGATYHAGPNRMYVSLARRWAARGYNVLRVDLAGLGDSDTRAGRPPNEVYPPGAVADVRAAVEFMRSRYGVRELTLAGLCSGAYHCLRAAVAGLPAERILLVNPLTFFWKEGMTLSDLQDAEVMRGPAVYRERIRSGKSWKKLLTGRVDPRPIARTLLHRGWLALDSSRRNLARRLRIRLADDLGWELEELCARGVRVAFFFARGDNGAALLRIQAGSAIGRLGDRCRTHFVDGADHIFSQSKPRALLEQLLEYELTSARTAPAGLAAADPAVPPPVSARTA